MFILLNFFDQSFAGNLGWRIFMGALPVVILVLIFTILVNVSRRKTVEKAKIEKMLAEDDAANQTRAQDIEENFFYIAKIEDLPVKIYSEADIATPHPAYIWQEKVNKIYQNKMLKFPQKYTNVELKHMFGVANLEFVARYEENFTNYIHALRHWAQALLDTNQTNDARQILEVATAAGAEISQVYTMLAEIYFNLRETNKLNHLKQTLNKQEFPGKNIALQHIDKLA